MRRRSFFATCVAVVLAPLGLLVKPSSGVVRWCHGVVRWRSPATEKQAKIVAAMLDSVKEEVEAEVQQAIAKAMWEPSISDPNMPSWPVGNGIHMKFHPVDNLDGCYLGLANAKENTDAV